MPKKIEIINALNLINSLHGQRGVAKLKRAAWSDIRKHMEEMTCDIDALESVIGDIDPRYTLREVAIPQNKRGNLAKYAGKRVYLFTTTVSRFGGRIEFYICEI